VQPDVRLYNGSSSPQPLMWCPGSQSRSARASRIAGGAPKQARPETHMKRIVLATALAITALAGSFCVPVQAQPFWYSGSGPAKGSM
jgi:hypothetical protein